MKMQNRADIVFLLVQNLLVIGAAQESQYHPIRSQRRLDDIGDVTDIFLVVEISKILPGHLLMASQVIVGPVRDPPELSPAEGEQELDIRRRLAVEAQLLLRVIPEPHLFRLHTKLLQPVAAERPPVIKPLQIRIRLTEELQLHLFELTRTEGKVSGCDFIPERLADLSDSERNFLSGRTLHVLEIDKNALRGFRTEINGILRVLRNALERLEHQVKLPDIRKIVFSAAGTGDLMLFNKAHHLFL